MRPQLKRENPGMKNTEISKLLGQAWKVAPEDVRKPHIEREHREREDYKRRIAKWRKERKEEENLKKLHRQAITEQYIMKNTADSISSLPRKVSLEGADSDPSQPTLTFPLLNLRETVDDESPIQMSHDASSSLSQHLPPNESRDSNLFSQSHEVSATGETSHSLVIPNALSDYGPSEVFQAMEEREEDFADYSVYLHNF